jgi:asparagine synthase (glutamine-hydrolysing)
MCGIAGWFSPDIISKECEPDLQRMIHSILHRGPDGQGNLIVDHAALGHARLSVIDLDTGKQPMSLYNKYQIVFNGEIYNYQKLRENLTKKGHKFQTKSDTEVILALYAEYGKDAFSLLRGMFAVAIWDCVNQCGILARDVVGIKPLFYEHKANGELVFGSEAKAILARQDKHQCELNENALHLLMNFRYLPGDMSLFKGIRQLEPGVIMQWSANKPVKKYTFEFKQESQAGSVLDEFEHACQLHLASDVEVGAYLSGGIDSAGITAIVARHSVQRLKTFTLDIGDDPNEANNAARTAEILNVDNVLGNVNHEINRQLLDLVWHLEVPKVNALQISSLAQLASKDVKVVLSGLGGDELFLGYNAHKIMHQAKLADRLLPRMLSGIISTIVRRGMRLTRLPVWSEPERAMLMLGSLGDWPRVYGLLRNVWDDPKLRKKIYGPRMLDVNLDNAFDHIRQNWTNNTDPVASTANFEWHNKMVNDLLWQEDRCSMAVGLEVRVPFLDPVLVNRVQSIPREQLMPNGQLKGYMRSMFNELLPDEIMKRPKSGFQLDAEKFFNSKLRQLADDWLSPDKIREMELFNPDFVKMVRAYSNGKAVRWHYFMLYMMIMTHLWVHMFEKGERQ